MADSIIDGRGSGYKLVINSDGSINTTASAGAPITSYYQVQDLYESGTYTFIGKEKNDGSWLFVKMDETTDLTLRYANVSNNGSYTTYALAAGSYTVLAYEYLEDLTF